MHRASGRAIGRALLCRRIIICAPVRRCKGSRRHPSHGTYTWPRPQAPATSVWIFFLWPDVLHLRTARRPNFVQPTSLFRSSFSSSPSRLEIDQKRSLEHAWIATTFCRRIFAFLSVMRMAGSMRAATSVMVAVTTPGHSKPSWANDTSRSDEFEGRRTGAAIRLGISGLKTSTLFPTSSVCL